MIMESKRAPPRLSPPAPAKQNKRSQLGIGGAKWKWGRGASMVTSTSTDTQAPFGLVPDSSKSVWPRLDIKCAGHSMFLLTSPHGQPDIECSESSSSLVPTNTPV